MDAVIYGITPNAKIEKFLTQQLISAKQSWKTLLLLFSFLFIKELCRIVFGHVPYGTCGYRKRSVGGQLMSGRLSA